MPIFLAEHPLGIGSDRLIIRKIYLSFLLGLSLLTSKLWRERDESSLVDVAQLVEPQIVDLVVVGSSPIIHPNDKSNQHQILR